MKKCYFPYKLDKKLNYIFLLHLYDIACYNPDTKSYDTIKYNSQKELAGILGIGASTLAKYLSMSEYSAFFTVDTKQRIIKLNNTFKKGTSANFIILTDTERAILSQSQDNFLCSYYFTIKKRCSLSLANNTKNDCTAFQSLAAMGYSNCQANIDKISKANNKLVEEGLISISKYRDSRGYCRNIYSVNY